MKIMLATPQVYAKDWEMQYAYHKATAALYGHELIEYPVAKMMRENKVIPIKNNFLDDVDIVVGDINYFRDREPDAGTIFTLGVGFAKEKRLYTYLDKLVELMKVRAGGKFNPDGTILDTELPRPGRYAEARNSFGNLMYTIPSKVIGGNFEEVLKIINIDNDELEKDRGSRIDPRVDNRNKATLPLGECHRAYLAGFEVFYGDNLEYGEMLKDYAKKCGFEGLFPADDAHGLEVMTAEKAGGWNSCFKAYIFDRDQQHVRNSDSIIANVNSFHGPDPDSGTVFECGMSFGLGNICYGFMDATTPMIDRIDCFKEEDGRYYDLQSYIVEDFGMPHCAMLAATTKIIEGDFKKAYETFAKENPK